MRCSPYQLKEIPYPWDEYHSLGLEMPVWEALNSWIVRYVAPTLGLMDSAEDTPWKAWQVLENRGIRICSQSDYDRLYYRLNNPAISPQNMGRFLSRMIDDIGMHCDCKIEFRGTPEWITVTVNSDREYIGNHGRSIGMPCFARGNTCAGVSDGWWEIWVDQDDWIKRQIDFPGSQALSIDRQRASMLLGYQAWTYVDVPLQNVLSDYLALGLEVPADWQATLNDNAIEIKRLMKVEHHHTEEARSAESVGNIAAIRKANHCRDEARDKIEQLKSDGRFDKCTEADRQKIINFVEKYGFPFIPFESNLEFRTPQLRPYFTFEERRYFSVLRWDDEYFETFKRYYRQFSALWDTVQRGKQYDYWDLAILQHWIAMESTVELDLSRTLRSPETKTRISTISRKHKCSFLNLVDVLTQANKETRYQGVGNMFDGFAECKYCKAPIAKDPRTKYPQFRHCSQPECKKQSKNDIRKWRMKNDPTYLERVKSQTRDRVARFRNRTN